MEPGPLPQFEDIDLREDGEAGKIIAEWLSDEAPEGGQPADERARRLVRSAQSRAEQAIDESVVPSRYHSLIRRFFGRLDDTFDRAARDTKSDPDTKPSGDGEP